LELRNQIQAKGIGFKLMNVGRLIGRYWRSPPGFCFRITSGVEFFPAVSRRGPHQQWACVLRLAQAKSISIRSFQISAVRLCQLVLIEAEHISRRSLNLAVISVSPCRWVAQSCRISNDGVNCRRDTVNMM